VLEVQKKYLKILLKVQRMKSFNEFLKDNGITGRTYKQYLSQTRKFLIINNYMQPIKRGKSYKEQIIKISGINKTDEELLYMCKSFCFKNRYVYNRRYAMKYFLKYIDKYHIYEELKKETRSLNKYVLKDNSAKTISYEELKLLMDSIPEMYSLIFKIQFECSFRVSEVLSLTKRNITKKDDRIKISTKQKGGGQVTAYLSKETTTKLKDYFKDMVKEGKIKTENDLIFNISYNKLWFDLNKYSQDIIDKKISSHWFKHQKADYLANVLGIQNIFDIKEALHHSNIETTLKYFRKSGIKSEKIIEHMEDNKVY